MIKIKSLRFKANILYSAILILILVLYSSVLFFVVQRILFQDLDDKLRIKASEIAKIINAYQQLENNRTQPGSIMQRLLSGNTAQVERTIVDDWWKTSFETLNLKQDYIAVLNNAGQILLYSANINNPLELEFHQHFGFSLKREYFGSVKMGSKRLHLINFPFLFKEKLPLVIQVATPMDAQINVLNKLLGFIILSIFLILVISAFIGSFFVSRLMKPVNAVTRAANAITHRDLSVRIQKKELDWELEILIDSFNQMIERLENSFKYINEFSSFAAHELKTPLAIMRGELELALSLDRTKEEYQKTIEDCQVELNRMIKIVQDLLLLAKLDYKMEIFNFLKLEFNEFIKEIAEQTTILAATKHIHIVFEPLEKSIFINADKIHLRRLFFNIISNAVKFTPESGIIHIICSCTKSQIKIKISDTGIGIPPQHLQKVFDKFYKIRNESEQLETGNGLGLSIAMSIAKAHQGNISVTSQPGIGSEFAVTLPILP